MHLNNLLLIPPSAAGGLCAAVPAALWPGPVASAEQSCRSIGHCMGGTEGLLRNLDRDTGLLFGVVKPN